MYLKHLSLTQFRNFARLDTDIPKQTVMLVGNNAQGKTSILEAIYYLATLTSFHADRDRQLINLIESRKSLAVARIVAEFDRGGHSHQLEIRIIKEKNVAGTARTRKEILFDGVKKKAVDTIGQFNAVLFLPQMMQVVEGAPDDRRRYFDLAISQVNPGYAASLSEYRKVLQQRNALLKQLFKLNGEREQLSFWDERLAKRGAKIILARIQAIQEIENFAGAIHHDLTRGEEVLRLSYQPAYDPAPPVQKQTQLLVAPVDRSSIIVEKIESGLLARLKTIRGEEIQRGVTTIGPHRDEVRFLSNGIDLGIYGSRGQVRSTMMTMKLAEMAWMKSKTGFEPVLLLDEVLAELDEYRRVDLLARVTSSSQTLLSTTDKLLFEENFLKKSKILRIHDGRLEDTE
ncbi:MAG: DNA replication/repair protein RecF [Chloroflexota bacterium]